VGVFVLLMSAHLVVGRSAVIRRMVRGSYLGTACVLSLVTMGVLACTLLLTIHWGDQPPSPGLSREPIFADYAVPTLRLGTEGTTTTYEAQTAFWQLLPDALRNSVDLRMSFSGSAPPQAVYAEGVEVVPGTSSNPGDGRFYAIPPRLIQNTTSIAVKGTDANQPTVYLHWDRSYIGAAPPVVPWWQSHLGLTGFLAITYLLAFGLVFAWCLREITRVLTGTSAIGGLILSFVWLAVASVFTTAWDLQLYKGLGEDYWVAGPLPALAISGYGPLVDLLFTVPMLPYVLMVNVIGAHSELALNLAIRLPFLLGWLFLIATVARLSRCVEPHPSSKFPWLLLFLNPLGLMVTLWQPEALLVGLVVLSLALLFEGRPVLAGVILGIAFSGKYWPVVIGPISLIAAWRLLGREAATKYLIASCTTALSILAFYWLPTAILLKSPSEFVSLLVTRLPWFGGSNAAAEATLWSLYSFPEKTLPSGIASLVSAIEQKALALFLMSYVAVIATCLFGAPNRRKVVLASAAVLALLAGMSSLSVPQFGLWTLPLAIVAGASARRTPTFMWLATAATWCAVGVSLFVEPISYYLLHMSAAEDNFAHLTGGWLLQHMVNQHLADVFGFWFAFLLVAAGLYMLAELALVKSEPTILPKALIPTGSH
jgi:hypothetical protein